MSRDFARWCGVQLKAINGSDDVTLAQFCMTIDEPEQIREYLGAYLGAGAAVTRFANEFIARKDAESSAQWKVTSRKGRKKTTA